MRDAIASERFDTAIYSRLDVIAFIGTAVGGAALYFLLRQVDAPQWTKTVALVGALFLYAIAVSRVPRLRVRLDQAGDNAYYLGLLFTLMSMAVALYEFSVVTEEGGDQSGTSVIIGNFGIALATTIAGIFIRVVLHQMRVDPGDVEGMTRIELAEASKRVKAELDTVSMQMGRFHEELQQRSSDVLYQLLEDSKTRLSEFTQRVTDATGELVSNIEKSHVTLQPHVEKSISLVQGLTDGTAESLEKLKKVEAPPLKMANRLEKVTGKLEALENSLQGLMTTIEGTTESTVAAVTAMSHAAVALRESEARLQGSSVDAMQRIEQSADSISSTVARVSETLSAEASALSRLEQQHRTYAESIQAAEHASEAVLKALTEAAKNMTQAIRDATR